MALCGNDAKATQRLHLLVHSEPLGALGSHLRLTLFSAQSFIKFNGLNVFFNVTPQHNVSASARHVGGNGDHARTACLRNDVSLSGMLLGIQHLMGQFGFGEHLRNEF